VEVEGFIISLTSEQASKQASKQAPACLPACLPACPELAGAGAGGGEVIGSKASQEQTGESRREEDICSRTISS
jgi:hypothetical protein